MRHGRRWRRRGVLPSWHGLQVMSSQKTVMIRAPLPERQLGGHGCRAVPLTVPRTSPSRSSVHGAASLAIGHRVRGNRVLIVPSRWYRRDTPEHQRPRAFLISLLARIEPRHEFNNPELNPRFPGYTTAFSPGSVVRCGNHEQKMPTINFEDFAGLVSQRAFQASSA